MITSKEREILQALITSVPRKSIGEKVGLSTRGVERSLLSMKERFHCASTYALIHFATTHNLLAQNRQAEEAE